MLDYIKWDIHDFYVWKMSSCPEFARYKTRQSWCLFVKNFVYFSSRTNLLIRGRRGQTSSKEQRGTEIWTTDFSTTTKISIYQIESFFVNISQVGKYECSTALYTYTNWQTSIWKEANDMLSPNVNDTDLEAISLQCKYDISNSSNNNKDKANDWRQEREVTQPFCKALVAKT